jgi:hypothetical protein
MDSIQVGKRNFDGLAWGAFFVWWGVTELFPSLPSGTWAVGFGLILIGLTAARSLNGLPTNGFMTAIGIIALVWGGLDMAGILLNLPFELPVFAIVLLALGVIVLAQNLSRSFSVRP